MDVSLLYGRGAIDVCLPGDVGVTVIRKPTMPILDDPADAVHRALDDVVRADSANATGASRESIESVAANAASACIAICDITRPVPMANRPLRIYTD